MKSVADRFFRAHERRDCGPRGGGAAQEEQQDVCAVDTATLVSQFDPGQLAMQAAYRYMQGAFDSPRLAAEDCGVDRQLVH